MFERWLVIMARVMPRAERRRSSWPPQNSISRRHHPQLLAYFFLRNPSRLRLLGKASERFASHIIVAACLWCLKSGTALKNYTVVPRQN